MKYLLILCLIIIIILASKIIAMRMSIKELRKDYEERAKLRSNTLLTVSSRDKEVRLLAKAMNNTLEKLRDSYNRYELGDREIKSVITNISHDLRTPLTAISGYLELAERKEKSPELEKYLDVIKGRTEHMKKLTEELFEYSIITGGEINEEKQDVNVNKVLEDCIMNYYPALKKRGITPIIEITDEKIIRNLYPTYVERIMNNLISNAIKYSDGDFDITLTDDGRLRVANTSEELSTVDVNKLFDRFFTVQNARKNSTGLGLSIVKIFAERMDCSVDASYTDGKIIIEIGF
ncbi:sensor histidine kinase [Butyrivibrio sp. WCE2006]|uniref:sensor histidine kinase n=1 Tax=Butyrivibrio sp. WCE2006 TaxID=1410611 RepID=UPI0009DEA683|nr:HAMP domain-containing sensor histidine kinase [Butyrivibrio sp. WCE2006]